MCTGKLALELPARWRCLQVPGGCLAARARTCRRTACHETKGLKGRVRQSSARRATRNAPILLKLVAILRAHIEHFGTSTDGRIFRSENDNPIQPAHTAPEGNAADGYDQAGCVMALVFGSDEGVEPAWPGPSSRSPPVRRYFPRGSPRARARARLRAGWHHRTHDGSEDQRDHSASRQRG